VLYISSLGPSLIPRMLRIKESGASSLKPSLKH
jgi:hypothetical protein